MTDVDQLLAKARLNPTAPYTRDDISAAEQRLLHTLATRRSQPQETQHSNHLDTPGKADRPSTNRPRSDFAADLRTMCEIVVTRPDALTTLHTFLSRFLPEPQGAGVLGSILHLSGAQESAQFWWQYAAGGGDHPAAYCLYLHHHAHGEGSQANWWYHQADLARTPLGDQATEAGRSVALRVLRALKGNRSLPDSVTAALAYVPAAVGYVDDFELPLPDEDFTERLAHLLDRAAKGGPTSMSHRPRSARPVLERRNPQTGLEEWQEAAPPLPA